jgi:hypothetical protein
VVLDPVSYLACDLAVHWAPLLRAVWTARPGNPGADPGHPGADPGRPRAGPGARAAAGSVLLLLAYAATGHPLERYGTTVEELVPPIALATPPCACLRPGAIMSHLAERGVLAEKTSRSQWL